LKTKKWYKEGKKIKGKEVLWKHRFTDWSFLVTRASVDCDMLLGYFRVPKKQGPLFRALLTICTLYQYYVGHCPLFEIY
jgi:hypothetical protein